MEQRRRRSFFLGDDGKSHGGGSDLPMLSPGGSIRGHRKTRWSKAFFLIVALLAVSFSAYYFLFAPSGISQDDHQTMLDKIGKMSPEELEAHRAERMARHREKIGKRAPKRKDSARGNPVQTDSSAREREQQRVAEQRRQRRESARGSGDARNKDQADAKQPPPKKPIVYQPDGKPGNAKKPALPTKPPVAMAKVAGKGGASGTGGDAAPSERRGRPVPGGMPGSPEDLKARRAESVRMRRLWWHIVRLCCFCWLSPSVTSLYVLPQGRKKDQNDREMARRRADLEKRKAAYEEEVAQRKAGAVAKGKEAAAARDAARKIALEKQKQRRQQQQQKSSR